MKKAKIQSGSIQVLGTITFVISGLVISYFFTVLFNNIAYGLLGGEESNYVELPYLFGGVYEKIEIFVNSLNLSSQLVEEMLFTIKLGIFLIRVLILLLMITVATNDFNKYVYENKGVVLTFFPSTGLFCCLLTVSFLVENL